MGESTLGPWESMVHRLHPCTRMNTVRKAEDGVHRSIGDWEGGRGWSTENTCRPVSTNKKAEENATTETAQTAGACKYLRTMEPAKIQRLMHRYTWHE